jgi:hypothetical protein
VSEIVDIEEEERQLRKNQANLYMICTNLIAALNTWLPALPPPIQTLLTYLTRFPKPPLKYFFFVVFLVPCMESYLKTELPRDWRGRIKSVCEVVEHVGTEKEFPREHDLVFMNRFLEDNHTLVSEMLLSSTKKRKIPSVSMRGVAIGGKEGLSPCLLTIDDVERLVTICTESPIFKSSDVTDDVKEALQDLTSWTYQTVSSSCLVLFNSFDVEGIIPDESEFFRNVRTNSVEFLLQRVLVTAGYIDIKEAEENTLEQILESLYMKEKLHHRILTALSVRSLIKNLPLSTTSLFTKLRKDILGRRSYLYQLIDHRKKLLRVMDMLEEQVDQLTKEKDLVIEADEIEHIGIFLDTINMKEFLIEFKKCAFVEDQVVKLQKFYLKLLDGLIQYCGKHQLSLTSAHKTRLQRFLLTKVYRMLVSDTCSFSQKDRVISEKIAQLSYIEPHHIDIKDRYWSMSDSKIAQAELARLDILAHPVDKMLVITQCSSIIIEGMRLTGVAIPSLDDFLPILIYNIIKAKPLRLYSNIQYIVRFLDIFSEKTLLENEYWLKHFEAALMFLESVDSIQLLNEKNKSSVLSDDISAADVMTEEEDYFENKDVSDLKISDIPLLLNAYKKLLHEKKNHSEQFLQTSMDIIQERLINRDCINDTGNETENNNTR